MSGNGCFVYEVVILNVCLVFYTNHCYFHRCARSWRQGAAAVSVRMSAKRISSLTVTTLIRIVVCTIVLVLCILVHHSHHQSPPYGENVAASAARKRLASYVTIVTAYWTGSGASKGRQTSVRNQDVSQRDLESFAYVINPVVAYFDDRDNAATFEEIRIGLPTKVIVVDPRSLWSFQLEDNITALLTLGHQPLSIDVTLTCITYAKYDVLSLAIESNYFESEVLAWLDVTYYREIIEQHAHAFRVSVPPSFMTDRVAFNAPYYRKSYTISKMFAQGLVWVNSDIIIGNADKLKVFCADFRHEAVKYLTHGLVNTDEQVIYAMFSEYNDYTPRVKIQDYHVDSHFDRFHYLGFLLREIWYKKIKPINN